MNETQIIKLRILLSLHIESTSENEVISKVRLVSYLQGCLDGIKDPQRI